MTTQRMGRSAASSTDAPTVVLFISAAILTIVAAALSIAAFVEDWPPTLVNFSLALMVVNWGAAFERHRFAKDGSRRRIAEAIAGMERFLRSRR